MSFILKNVKVSPIKNIVGQLNISSDYGKRNITVRGEESNDFHTGIDITNLGEIIAIEDGVVTEVEKNIKGFDKNKASGNYVLIYHGVNNENKKIYTKYNHLDYGSISLNVNDKILKNQKLGTNTIKTTGYSTGRHLHFAVREDSDFVDPKPYLLGTKSITPSNNNNDVEYVVKKGDTLSYIANKYGFTYKYLAEYNNITNPDLIRIGQIIKIPNNEFENIIDYEIKKGDTLWDIAVKYLKNGIRYKEIAEYNNITNPNKIKVGQKIKIKIK